MIEIDGSFGEGGGQILRTSIGLSLLSGKPLEIRNIRANRKPPGLRKQHLTAVLAAAEISGAEVRGAAVGSDRLTFVPHEVKTGSYRFSTGTAGSTTLVLQTLLPALLTASGSTELVLEGGTHNVGAPPFEFLDKCFLPFVNRMGPTVTARLVKPGFYPAGGGEIHVRIDPSAKLTGFDLMERGEFLLSSASIRIANLPGHIAERESSVLSSSLDSLDQVPQIIESAGPGPGNVVLLESICDNVTEVFCSFGRQGVRAEQVATDVARDFLDYLESGVPVGSYLADQLILLLALAGQGGFLTGSLSQHTETNIEVIRQFLDVIIEVDSQPVHQTILRVNS